MIKEHSETVYEIAIIGGGIAGAGIARDAALRGLKVILFEKNSFGSGTSSKSSKLIHGGIRYLELSWNALKKLDFKEAWKNLRFVFLSLKEGRILRKIAPDLIHPLPLFIPIYSDSPRKRLSIFFGAYFYYFLSLLSGSGKCPRFFGSQKSALRIVPHLEPKGLLGGVLIWDHLTDDLKLVQETMNSAIRHGATCLENSEVTQYKSDNAEQKYAISVRLKNGETEAFFSKKLVNASGPWVDKVRQAHGEKDRYLVPVAGSHIELKKFLDTSMILQANDGRLFFIINIGDRSRVGTTEWSCLDPDAARVTEKDIDYLLDSLSRYFPSKSFKRADILNADSGVRPLSASWEADNTNSISRDHEIKVDSEGVLNVLGVKLTDYRRAAKNTVDILLPSLSSRMPKARSRTANFLLKN